MRKIISVIFAIFLMFSFPLTVAATGSTTINVKVPEPSYQLNVPANMDITYLQDKCSMTAPTISGATGFKSGMNIQVTITHNGKFSSECASTTIPYSLDAVLEDGSGKVCASGTQLYYWNSGDGAVNAYGCLNGENSNVTTLQMNISPEAWEPVLPGAYSTTIYFTSSLFVTE